MSEADEILKAVKTVVVVDWPSQDVPLTLTRAGYAVLVKGGPEPDRFSAYERGDGEAEVRPVGSAPKHADLVYCHRPLEELPEIVAMATRLSATAVWCQSGVASDGAKDPTGCWLREEHSQQARRIVESAGLRYIDDVYVADAVREMADPS